MEKCPLGFTTIILLEIKASGVTRWRTFDQVSKYFNLIPRMNTANRLVNHKITNPTYTCPIQTISQTIHLQNQTRLPFPFRDGNQNLFTRPSITALRSPWLLDNTASTTPWRIGQFHSVNTNSNDHDAKTNRLIRIQQEEWLKRFSLTLKRRIRTTVQPILSRVYCASPREQPTDQTQPS